MTRERFAVAPRPTDVRHFWAAVGAAVLVLTTACQGEDSGSPAGGDCTSRYDPVAAAPTWPRLRTEMLAYDERGRVASLRTQARGQDVGGAGAEDAVRVVDLLGPGGRRVVQVDVWRTADDGWAAGSWSQCID